MKAPLIMLVDNGSTRPDATRSLRRIAAGLSAAAGMPVHPVSLQHADRVPADELDGQPARVFPDFLREQLEAGHRSFVTVPLFFGNSRALTSFIPEQVQRLSDTFGRFQLVQAGVLSPVPDGEPRLADIVADHVAVCSDAMAAQPDRVVVVDHGSPLREVTAVRARVADLLRERLDAGVTVSEAVMERRSGRAYDFNGMLLEDVLRELGPAQVVLAMLFISPGRHAGPGGDIVQIVDAAMRERTGLHVGISRLVGEHPALIEILQARLDRALQDHFP